MNGPNDKINGIIVTTPIFTNLKNFDKKSSISVNNFKGLIKTINKFDQNISYLLANNKKQKCKRNKLVQCKNKCA